MCGICGIYNLNGREYEKILREMAGKLAHRGPDDEGFYFTENIGLGHRRLSILDLSSAGHQPMSNEDGTLWITYNGEIYNFIELKEELIKLGHNFKSHTDTEVILHSFEEWGADCQNRFNGMWAFSIWDEKSKTLFCSRDRFGVKPFYYYFNGTVFSFTSEIKALLCLPDLKKEPNEKKIYDFLVTGLVDNDDETFFKDVKQLEPGHCLILKENKLKIERYYRPSFNKKIGTFDEKKCGELSKKFIDLLEDSIRLRFRSDVEVASCLSGGLDSSTIVALSDKLINKKIKTFSICSQDLRFDEREYIEKVSKKFESESHYVFPSHEEFLKDIGDLIWTQEEPFRPVAIYGHWRLMKLAKENKIKVLLIGEGADELLGYPEQMGSFFFQAIASGKLSLLFKEIKAAVKIKGFAEVKRIVFLLSNQIVRYVLPQVVVLFLRKKMIGDLSYINKSFYDKFVYNDEIPREARINFQKILYERTMRSGLRYLLNFEDKNSMAFSVENRPPFLDYRLVEFIFSLPATYKMHDSWPKYLIRNSTEGLLPEEIRWRKYKEGLLTPALSWLKENKEYIRKIFESEDFRAGRYIDRKLILDRFDDFFIKCNEKAPEIWKYVSLELWLKTFF